VARPREDVIPFGIFARDSGIAAVVADPYQLRRNRRHHRAAPFGSATATTDPLLVAAIDAA
jgi:hypothetical protein